MSRKHEEPTVSRHIELYASDWEVLLREFGRGSDTKLGVGVAIRQMVRKGVRDYQERVTRRVEGARAAPTVPLPALDKFFTPHTEGDPE